MLKRKSEESSRSNATHFRAPFDTEKKIENNLIKEAALTIKKLEFNRQVYDRPQLQSQFEEKELETEKRKLYEQLSVRKRD